MPSHSLNDNQPIARVIVAGTGVLGAQIAFQRAFSGIDVVAYDVDTACLDRADIEKIWLEPCGSSHWQRTDLSRGCATADHALTVAFPWLPDQVRAQLVRAAAYQWR